MNRKVALLAAASVFAATAASAGEGIYGSIGAGLSYNQNDLQTKGFGVFPFTNDADFKNGIGVYTALGYAFEGGLRTEFEYSYRQNDTRFIAGDGLGFAGFNPLDGDLSANAFMVNGIYDFARDSVVSPYVGVGVGVARFKYDASASVNGVNGINDLAIDDKSMRLAAQGIAGLAIGLADNLDLDVSYRYFTAVKSPKFDATVNGGPEVIKSEYANHSVFAGLRFSFAPPPPPPPADKECWDGSVVPVTADCPPQIMEQAAVIPDPIDFTVYFDFDKANLTPEAASLVQEAAARALDNDIQTIVVAGNTDTSGSAAYNQRLSERRAAVVRDALIANGVPAERIVTEAFGETRPAKPTPDGVREPLNRRTEVTISFQ